VWLFFALLSPLLWAIVHILDWYCVDEIFTDRPWMGVIMGAIASCVLLPVLPLLVPHWQATPLPAGVVAVALTIGLLLQISQALYFESLARSDAAAVSAYWNFVPMLLPIASFFLLGQVLSPLHYGGIGVLVVASICFCLTDSDRQTRWLALGLMAIASGFQVAALLLENYVFQQGPFLLIFMLIALGSIGSGLLPLVLRPIRQEFHKCLRVLSWGMGLIVTIELVNLMAVAASQRAISLGIPALVAAIETTIPAYVFALSLVLSWLLPQVVGPTFRQMRLRLVFVGLMAMGVTLLT